MLSIFVPIVMIVYLWVSNKWVKTEDQVLVGHYLELCTKFVIVQSTFVSDSSNAVLILFL